MGSFKYRSILKRLEKMEQSLLIDEENKLFSFQLMDPVNGGLFGHSHVQYRLHGKDYKKFPCTDEEEIELMRRRYEGDNHKYFGVGEELTFPDYLEQYFYFSPNVPDERKKAAVQKLREQEKALITQSANSALPRTEKTVN